MKHHTPARRLLSGAIALVALALCAACGDEVQTAVVDLDALQGQRMYVPKEEPSGEVPGAEQPDVTPPAPLDVCVTRGDGCLCSFTQLARVRVEGRWRDIAPGVVEIAAADGTTQTVRYCADDTYLDVELTTVDFSGIERRTVTRWAR